MASTCEHQRCREGSQDKDWGKGYCPTCMVFPGLEERSRHSPSRLDSWKLTWPGAPEGTTAVMGCSTETGMQAASGGHIRKDSVSSYGPFL